MEKDVIMWLMGIFVSINTTAIVFSIGWVIKMTSRMVKMETTLELLGYNSAKSLHNPHTFELDNLLEKYCKAYEEKDYDLPYEDWIKLKQLCDEIIEDKSLPTGYRSAAGIVSALCKHKSVIFNKSEIK